MELRRGVLCVPLSEPSGQSPVTETKHLLTEGTTQFPSAPRPEPSDHPRRAFTAGPRSETFPVLVS